MLNTSAVSSNKIKVTLVNTILLGFLLLFSSGCTFFYHKVASFMGFEPELVESVSGYIGKGKKLGEYMKTCQKNGGSPETCAAPGLLLKKCVGEKEQDSCDRFDAIIESGKPDEKLKEFTKHIKDSIVLKGSEELLGLQAKPHFDKEPKGLLVASVEEGSVWEKSGAKPGEIITEINGVPITKPENILKIVTELMANPKDLVEIKSVPPPSN